MWRPIRRAMGLTGIRANAYTGRKAGDEVIEPHDEMSQAAGQHEEVYVVLTGSARFTIEGEETHGRRCHSSVPTSARCGRPSRSRTTRRCW